MIFHKITLWFGLNIILANKQFSKVQIGQRIIKKLILVKEQLKWVILAKTFNFNLTPLKNLRLSAKIMTPHLHMCKSISISAKIKKKLWEGLKERTTLNEWSRAWASERSFIWEGNEASSSSVRDRKQVAGLLV